MLVIDPLTSVVDGKIDTHRDRELRGALEPLARLTDETGGAVVGLAHHGKAATTDPLSLVLGSRACTAVARAVLAAARDPEPDDGSCVLSLEKSNLGPAGRPGAAVQGRAGEPADRRRRLGGDGPPGLRRGDQPHRAGDPRRTQRRRGRAGPPGGRRLARRLPAGER